MTETDKAYIAGFIDGEGSIGLRKCHTNRGYFDTIIRLRITNTNRDVLEWIKAKTGIGSVRQWARCSDKHKARFEWYCAGKKALIVLREVHPYLLIKKINADICFQYEKTMGGSGNTMSEETRSLRQSLRASMDSLQGHQRN